MAVPPAEFIDVDDVRAALGFDPTDIADDAWLILVVDAVNQFVSDSRADLFDPESGTWLADGRTVWGAVQLATRWYGRRNSQDIAAFAELGGPPPSIDRDIAVALRVDRYYRVVVA